MTLKGELNYVRGVMADLDTKEGQYHALKCVEAVVCKLYKQISQYQAIENKDKRIIQFLINLAEEGEVEWSTEDFKKAKTLG